jgi:pyruvate formate lyase activating enzyme
VGRRVTVEEVMREVLEDRVFYAASGGGLTLSGGEPTAQINFAVALLEAAKKEGLHCCMDTSGFTSWANFERLLPWVDLFLFDYKESDPQLHLDYTGRPNDAILRNLKALHDRGAAIQLQCPIIPGYNQREEHLRAIADLAEWLPGITGVMLLPYHQLGTEKLKRLGMPEGDNSLSAPGQVELARWTGLLRERGVRVLN